MADEKKKFGLGKGCLIVAGVIVALGVIGAIVGGGEGSAGSNTEAQKAASIPPVEVTARQLAKAYEENEAAAQQQYGDRPLLVSGTIDKIQLDFANKPFVVLQGENMFMGPQVHLTEEAQALAAQMKKGQKLTFLCAGIGEVVGTPMLEDCALGEPAK